MVQLRVYNDGTQYWLDLYEESPIKINLSVEDITSTDATSAFTRTFRVPGTAHNNDFFKAAFYVDSIDYDVTVKKSAEILIDGEPFHEGHIRLQKIYKNEDLDRYDYEIVFLGETRDFASALGDSPMCELNLDLIHTMSYANVTGSWQAYPEGGLTDGLLNGDVVYPLIDHGNTYDGAGSPIEGQIKVNTTQFPKSFTDANWAIEPQRLKPMIRAKALIDAIFASTDYNYESTFIDSNLFRKLYVSAFGNDTNIEAQVNESENLFNASSTLVQQATSLIVVPINNESSDPGNNFNPTNTGTSTQIYAYTAPLTGSYTFSASTGVQVQADQGTTAYATALLLRNGSQIASGSSNSIGVITVNATLNLTAGQTVQFAVDFTPTTDVAAIENGTFRCTAAPGIFNPVNNLDCEYKQIDFVKDLLTTFRLVMAPKKGNPTTFIIEPWVDYIASGDIFDWTDKLDRAKDAVLEPLFFTQSDRIEFKSAEDEDLINNYNQTAFKEVYGQLNFDSGSELLKDTREVTTEWSPTPFAQIDGAATNSTFVIPKLYTLEDGKSEPISPNTRFLFYNGLQSATTWYMEQGGTAQPQTQYPLASYHENWPPSVNDVQLNWNIQFPYYGDLTLFGINGELGYGLFDRYWSDYISSLYNKFSRRLTGHFVLDAVDLIEFSFDDIIFVDGTYYRPEKILDAPVGLEDKVKVQLIKLNNFKPSDQDAPTQFYYYEARIDTCTALSSIVYIIQSPVPLNNNDVVGVTGSTDCFRIMNPASTQIWDYAWFETFTDCQDCLDNNQQNFVYRVQRYDTNCVLLPILETIVSHTSALTVGEVVSLNGTAYAGCWKVVAISQVQPATTVNTVYPDCPTCFGQVTPTVYAAQYCDGSGTVFVASFATYTGGEVVRIDDACQSCVTITDFGPYTAQYNIIDQVYIDCDACNNQNFGQEPTEFDDNCREFDGV